MAAISRDDVAHLAKLARIEMTPAELDHMASELEQILGAVKRVQEVATSDMKQIEVENSPIMVLDKKLFILSLI